MARKAREINMDTLHQNFWAESIRKEASLRLSWSRKHKDSPSIYISMAGGGGDSSSKKILERHAAKLRSFVPRPVEREQERVKLPSINKPENITNGPVAKAETHTGKSKSTRLAQKSEKCPDNKDSRCDRGWIAVYTSEMPKEEPKFTPPKYGRTRIVRDTFYKRYGIFYDPNEV